MKLKAWPLVLPLVVGCVLACAASYRGVAQQSPPAASATPELPAGPGREPFMRICSGCHTTSTVTNERHTAEGWNSLVDDMRARGANGSDDEMDKISAWLALNYAPKADASSAPTTP